MDVDAETAWVELMDVDEETASPVKIYHQKNFEVKPYNCLICGKRAGKESLRSPKEQGITTFINALEVRRECNDFHIDHYKDMIDFESKSWLSDITVVKWHPKCYASYCNPKNLSYLTTSPSTNPSISKSSTRAKKPLINLKEKCMFCGYKKHHNDTKLILLQYDNVIGKLKQRCRAKNDEEFEINIGGNFDNLPAYDAKYHLGCFNSYMRETVSNKKEPSPHDICFEEFISYMDPLLEEGRALDMSSLVIKFKLLLKEKEYPLYDSYTAQKLKARITNHYGSNILFTDNVNSIQSVYSSKISIADVINIAANYKQSSYDYDLVSNVVDSKKKILERAADILVAEIQKVEGISIHPLDPEDISNAVVSKLVPSPLKEFLRCLCGNSNEKEKKISSVAQDIISLQSGGKKRMPKNVGLGLSLKNSVRSKEFITFLNNLGHCISYDDVLRIDTSWASGIIERDEGYATIPTNVIPNVFTQAASDNGDYGQENNSQHVTNTVLYQYNRISGTFPDNNVIHIANSKSRKRSISLPPASIERLDMLKKPELPRSYSEITLTDFVQETIKSDSRTYSSTLTTSWLLLRITGNKLITLNCDQKIPSWTGFRKLMTVNVQ